MHSSNLIDHVGLPNLILAARDVLKPNGFLFTALMVLSIGRTLEKLMEDFFGVPFEALPILYNMRCVGHDGPFGDGILPKPTSVIHELSSSNANQHISLVWQKVVGMPIHVAVLDPCMVRALVAQSVRCLLLPQENPHHHIHTNAVGVCKCLQTFVSQIAEEDVSWKSPEFWTVYCDALKQNKEVGLDLWELQTMMLKHGFHIHLKVTERDCPICNGADISEFVGSYLIRVDVGASYNGTRMNPYYKVFVHETEFGLTMVDETKLAGGTQRIRCLKGESWENYSELRFFFPRQFANPKFKFTVCHVIELQTTGMSPGTMQLLGVSAGALNIPCAMGIMSQALLHTGKMATGTPLIIKKFHLSRIV